MQRIERLRFSTLKRIAQSPAHLRHYVEHGQDAEQTAAQRFGTLIHALVLGGSVTVYLGERRGNAWKDFKSEHAGETIVTQSEHDTASRIRDAVFADPHAAELLKDAQTEQGFTCDMFGRTCGGTIDIVNPAGVVDLKSTHTADPRRFSRLALSMAYHGQLRWYSEAARAKKLTTGTDASIIAVETKAPYLVQVFPLTPRCLTEAEKLICRWLEQLAQCEASGHWPGYSQCPVELDVEPEADLDWSGMDEEEAA